MLKETEIMGNQMSENQIGTEEKKADKRNNFIVPSINISTNPSVITSVSNTESTTSETKLTENNESDVNINLKVFTKLSRNEYDIAWSPRQGFYLPQYYTRGGPSNLLGKGTISEVYKGIETQTKKSVAIKVLFLEKLTNINQISASENEVTTLSKLEHNNVVKILDSGQLNMQYKYIVLEHCELGCLQLNKPLSEDKSRELFRQLLCGLSYLKSMHILHRDIKPDNILVNAKGVLKIADFSLSIECPAVGHAISESLCGSPAYWAPEIWKESTYSYQSDLYAAGIVLYEMLTGNFPWKIQDKNGEQLQKAKNSKLVMSLLLSKEAKSLLKSLLNPNPTLRLTIEDAKTNAWVCKKM